MKRTPHIPLWVHLVCLSVFFFVWFGLSYFFGSRESLADSIIGAGIFTALSAIVDGVIWSTTKTERE